jgi:hypothetical protein
MRTCSRLALLFVVAFAWAPAADAHGWRGGGSRVFLGFNFAAPVYPYYYPPPIPYYYPPPVVYAPPPQVGYVQPPVAYQPPPAVSLGAPVGQGCREYTAPVNVGGRVVQSYGTACPRPDGSWQIVK